MALERAASSDTSHQSEYHSRVMSWETFVSFLTGDSTSQVSEAGHHFRDDSGAREGKDTQYFEKAPDWAEKTTESGISLFPSTKE